MDLPAVRVDGPEAFVKLLKPARHSPGGGGGGGECIGSAITMPHKISFMAHVDELTDEAAMIGSINTVFVRRHPETGERRYIGTNTDCIGVREAFLQKVPGVVAASRGKPALVIGGGGACRGAVYALWRWLGASVIYLANRVQSEVDDVTADFRRVGFPGKLVWVGSVAQARTLETPATIVGTIPDLPPREEGEIVCRQIVEEFLNRPTKGAMLDMCYHPNPVTALYRLAEAAGWRVVGGTEVMVAQGIAQQILWCEAPLGQFRLDHAVRLVHEELRRRRPK